MRTLLPFLLVLLPACGASSLGSWPEPELWIHGDGDNGLTADGCRSLSPNVDASLSNSSATFEFLNTAQTVDGCDGPGFNRVGGEIQVGEQTLLWTDGRDDMSMTLADLASPREWSIIAPTGGHPQLGADFVVSWSIDSDTLTVVSVQIEGLSAEPEHSLDGTEVTVTVPNDSAATRVNIEVGYSREVTACAGATCVSDEVLLDGWDI